MTIAGGRPLLVVGGSALGVEVVVLAALAAFDELAAGTAGIGDAAGRRV